MSSIAIINVDHNYSVMPKFGASLTDDSRGVIHDRNVFIIRDTGETLQLVYQPSTTKKKRVDNIDTWMELHI
jgi:hypothetical protein